jgi:hypothetical protein
MSLASSGRMAQLPNAADGSLEDDLCLGRADRLDGALPQNVIQHQQVPQALERRRSRELSSR